MDLDTADGDDLERCGCPRGRCPRSVIVRVHTDTIAYERPSSRLESALIDGDNSRTFMVRRCARPVGQLMIRRRGSVSAGPGRPSPAGP